MIKNRKELMSAMEEFQGQGYLIVSKMFNQEFGFEVGVLLSHLIDAHEYFVEQSIKNGTNWNGWFFQTVPTVQGALGMTRRQQEKAVTKLGELNMISVKKTHNEQLNILVRSFNVNWVAIDNFIKEQTDRRVDEYNKKLYEMV